VLKDEEFQEIVTRANQRADKLKAELQETAKAEKIPYP